MSTVSHEKSYITGYKETSIGKIPVVSTKLDASDIIDGWKARWNINRMNYTVEPGLYAIGNPDENSPVFVTANYKLTFDKFRKELTGIGGWILILDTKGVNVWCAAGKGTFGTKELTKRVILSKLDKLVNHNKLILPQLGSVGVSAHEIKKSTGFNVIYGPVLASDIPLFIKNSFNKTVEMKTVYFKMKDRIVLTPIELVMSLKYILIIFVIIGILSIIQSKAITTKIILDFIPFLASFLTGTILFPILLPYIPFRSFAIKGYILGIIFTLIIVLLFQLNIPLIIVYFLVLPVIVSFLALNFTGSSTYTSLTGTKIEVKISLPIYIVLIIAGVIIKILNTFNIV